MSVISFEAQVEEIIKLLVEAVVQDEEQEHDTACSTLLLAVQLLSQAAQRQDQRAAAWRELQGFFNQT